MASPLGAFRSARERCAANVTPPERERIIGNRVLPFMNAVKHRGRRGASESPASPARHEEAEDREYLTDEQRGQRGCIAGRMPSYS